MANRREKKGGPGGRKARSNIQRDRTVTELVEDPDTRQLLFTTREESATAIAHQQAQQQLAQQQRELQNQPTQSPNSFLGPPVMAPSYPPPFPYGPYGPPHMPYGPPQHPPMAYYNEDEQMMSHMAAMSATPIPGDNDLEVLENLKRMIKNGQHEIYRPIPRPDALANLYMGPHPSQGQTMPPQAEPLPPWNRAPSSASARPLPASPTKRVPEERAGPVQETKSSESAATSTTIPTPTSAVRHYALALSILIDT